MTAPAQQRYAGKAALITGAGSGIGRATALRLAAEGGDVLGLDINDAGLAETLAAAEGLPGRVVTRRADVGSVGECREAVAAAVGELGRIDVLGNIAGIGRSEHFTEVTEEGYRQMMAVNVDGYFFLTQAAVPHLLEHEGVVVNIASNAGVMGQAYTIPYCMTKGAVIQFTRALAMEYLKQPLRVVAIAPGGTDTGLVRNYQMPDGVDWDLVTRYTSARGFAAPEQIASLFAFLASDEAGNIHGAIVSSDNGLTAG